MHKFVFIGVVVLFLAGSGLLAVRLRGGSTVEVDGTATGPVQDQISPEDSGSVGTPTTEHIRQPDEEPSEPPLDPAASQKARDEFKEQIRQDEFAWGCERPDGMLEWVFVEPAEVPQPEGVDESSLLDFPADCVPIEGKPPLEEFLANARSQRLELED